MTAAEMVARQQGRAEALEDMSKLLREMLAIGPMTGERVLESVERFADSDRRTADAMVAAVAAVSP